MVVGAGLGAGRADGGIVDEKNVTGAVADNADTGVLAALVGQQVAEDVLGAQALQDGSGSVVFIADNRGSALAYNADFMKAFVVITYGFACSELFCPSVQAGEQFFYTRRWRCL